MKASQLPKRVRDAVGETLNKTEQRFAEWCLSRCAGKGIHSYQMKPPPIKLSDSCKYNPDALIVHNDNSIEFVDCKAAWPVKSKVRKKVSMHIHVEDDCLVKMKWARSLHPEWTFSLYGLHHKSGEWTRKEIK